MDPISSFSAHPSSRGNIHNHLRNTFRFNSRALVMRVLLRSTSHLVSPAALPSALTLGMKAHQPLLTQPSFSKSPSYGARCSEATSLRRPLTYGPFSNYRHRPYFPPRWPHFISISLPGGFDGLLCNDIVRSPPDNAAGLLVRS